MTARYFPLLLGLATSTWLLPGIAVAAGCTAHRAVCEAACTPARIATFHAGSLRRCEASCDRAGSNACGRGSGPIWSA